MGLPRMRILSEVMEEIRREDPRTAITKNYLYRAIRMGVLPSVQNGNRRYVNMDQLYEFLKNPPSLPPVRRAKIQAPTVQGIRKVDEYALPVLELAEYAGVEEFAMEGIRRVME